MPDTPKKHYGSYHFRYYVSAMQIATAHIPPDRYIHDLCVRQFGEMVTKDMMKAESDGLGGLCYRMDVIVLTAPELMRLIEKRARDLYFGKSFEAFEPLEPRL